MSTAQVTRLVNCICHTCQKGFHEMDSSLRKCSKCQTVKYCSADCQEADWPEHKKVCNAYKPGSIEAKISNAVNLYIDRHIPLVASYGYHVLGLYNSILFRKMFYLRIVLRYSPFERFNRNTFFKGIYTSAQPIASLNPGGGGPKAEEILKANMKQLEAEGTILVVFAVSELRAPLEEYGMEHLVVVGGLEREGEMLAQAEQIGLNRFSLLEHLIKATVVHH